MLDRTGRIRLVTDSPSLQKDYLDLGSRSFAVLPIPHTSSIRPPEEPDAQEGRICQVVLGDIREEKGFPLLVEALALLQAQGAVSRMHFRIQSNLNPSFPEMAVHRDRLANLGLENCELLTQTLTDLEYQSLLESAHVVILPYQLEQFRSRTSGPFAEAMAAGRVVVVTEGTWMSQQLEAFDGGGVTFPDGDAAGLAAALLEATSEYKTLQTKAARASLAFRAFHNPQSFIDHLAEVWQAKNSELSEGRAKRSGFEH